MSERVKVRIDLGTGEVTLNVNRQSYETRIARGDDEQMAALGAALSETVKPREKRRFKRSPHRNKHQKPKNVHFY